MLNGANFDKLYRQIGERRICILLYVLGACAHIIFALLSDPMASDSGELAAMTLSARIANNSAAPVQTGYGGILPALIFAPIMLISHSAFVQYPLMLILGSMFSGGVPVLVYALGTRIGVEKAWQRLTLAAICGLNGAAFVASMKVSMILGVLYPWVIFWMLTVAVANKKQSVRILLSVTLAVALGLAPLVHYQLRALIPAALIAVIYMRVKYKRGLVILRVFIPILLLFGIFSFLLQIFTHSGVLGGSAVWTGWRGFSLHTFLMSMIAQLHYFATATFGIGPLAMCLVCLREFAAEKKKSARKTNNTAKKDLYNKQTAGFAPAAKAKEKHKPGIVAAASASTLTVTAFFAVVFFIVDASAVSAFSGITESRVITGLSGQGGELLFPLLLMICLSQVFIGGLAAADTLCAVVFLGVIYSLFFWIGSDAAVVSNSAAMGLVTASPSGLLSGGELLGVASVVFCVMALLFVITCCTERYRKHVSSMAIIAVMLFTGIHSAVLFLPDSWEINRQKNYGVAAISEHVFNSADAPPLVAYRLNESDSALLWYMNQNARFVNIDAENIGDMPESGFVVVSGGDLPVLPPFVDVAVRLAETGEFDLYAYGERALAYLESQTGFGADLES